MRRSLIDHSTLSSQHYHQYNHQKTTSLDKQVAQRDYLNPNRFSFSYRGERSNNINNRAATKNNALSDISSNVLNAPTRLSD